MVRAIAGSPYSTIMPLVKASEIIRWAPAEDQERLAAYFKYDDIYWSVPETFALQQRGDDSAPIYVPNARTIVDTTSYYLLKGLKITVKDPAKNKDAQIALDALLEKEQFYSTFHTAKHSGVARGDFVIHVLGDEAKPEGERVSFESVLPHMYFEERDDDPQSPTFDQVIGVFLAEEWTDPADQKTYVKRLHYYYGDTVGADGIRTVFSEEGLYEVEDWSDDKKAKLHLELSPPAELPPPIDKIPVYLFKNQPWQGEDFGSSELRGFERLMAAVNQSISDEEVSLALDGLGVYATDAAGPVDENGEDVPWEIAPARVMEVPTGSFFKRVEGLSTVKPVLDHVKYLDGKLQEGSGTSDVALGQVDVATANSGIALAIKFMPTQAKLEERDIAGKELVMVMFKDWLKWHEAFEGDDLGVDTVEFEITLGDKLPINRTAVLAELNNMHDRNIISSRYYRQEMSRQLGYEFPDGMQEEIIAELLALKEAKMTAPTPDTGNLIDTTQNAPPTSGGDPAVTKKGSTVVAGNQSNNASRTNESGGTEAPPAK